MNVILSIQQVLNASSDGYTGIRLADEQLVNDVVFAWIVGMFVLFSIVYRNNFRLFLKMLQDFRTVKERQSLFLLASNREGFFRNFMTFQTLILITLALFSIARIQRSIPPAMSEGRMFLILLILFGILFFYYLFKQGMYFCIGFVFTTPQKYKLWKSGYNAVTGVWGILLYFPILWITYVDEYHTVAIWLFIILFILSRLVIIYKLIRIFYKKSDNLLYLILYLCAQEILPLVFLYEGLVYLYNFIETSTLWH